MQTIGLKMYQPWYNVKLIFRLSSYYPAFKRSLDGIDDFLRMVNMRCARWFFPGIYKYKPVCYAHL